MQVKEVPQIKARPNGGHYNSVKTSAAKRKRTENRNQNQKGIEGDGALGQQEQQNQNASKGQISKSQDKSNVDTLLDPSAENQKSK